MTVYGLFSTTENIFPVLTHVSQNKKKDKEERSWVLMPSMANVRGMIWLLYWCILLYAFHGSGAFFYLPFMAGVRVIP